MRQLTITFLTFIILTSCSNDNTSAGDNKVNQTDRLNNNFISILNGVWVLTDYINEIEKTKSPLKSSDRLEGVVTMVIDATFQSDSIDIGVSWNNHEGFNFMAFFESGQETTNLKTNLPDFDVKTNYFELGYEKINNKVLLALYRYNSSDKLIDKRMFAKVSDKQNSDDAAWGLQYMVNEKLFSGDYLLLDSTNNWTKVTLKSDGTITGYSGFKTYNVATDFLGGPKTILDEIFFNANERNAMLFAFIIQNDTTYLYSTIGNEEEGELLHLDKVKYKLVRQ
ncbi:MAG: hypothetical protein IH597_07855 [Bacteroidales bacterium]|nr:hypothetical protein [Bacteroidales bacterium]